MKILVLTFLLLLVSACVLNGGHNTPSAAEPPEKICYKGMSERGELPPDWFLAKPLIKRYCPSNQMEIWNAYSHSDYAKKSFHEFESRIQKTEGTSEHGVHVMAFEMRFITGV